MTLQDCLGTTYSSLSRQDISSPQIRTEGTLRIDSIEEILTGSTDPQNRGSESNKRRGFLATERTNGDQDNIFEFEEDSHHIATVRLSLKLQQSAISRRRLATQKALGSPQNVSMNSYQRTNLGRRKDNNILGSPTSAKNFKIRNKAMFNLHSPM